VDVLKHAKVLFIYRERVAEETKSPLKAAGESSGREFTVRSGRRWFLSLAIY
jgi:hypothetical protein